MRPLLVGKKLNGDSHLYLYELTDDQLDKILYLSQEELDSYINSLIDRFYTNKDVNKQELEKAYKASFVLEKLYRANNILHSNYTCIYTKTGLIREIVSDLYALAPEKTTIH